MRSIQQLIYVLFLFLFLPLCVNALDYYVDKNASGQNNGTNWADAWELFSAINWGSIDPGDVIYISGGTTSKICNEQLTVGASGNSTADILIRAGIDAGHNGEVIIDRDYASGRSIYI